MVISEYINDGDYTSYTAASVLLAVAGNIDSNEIITETVSVLADGNLVQHSAHDGMIVSDIPLNAKTVTVRCDKCDRQHHIYYTIISNGFPRNVNEKSNGIEITREYFDNNGNRITTATVGDTVTVKIHVRSRRSDTIPNVVIVDLVPGGFIAGDAMGDNISFTETREDRVLVFLDVTREGQTITYNAQVGTAGSFSIPPIYAKSMYNPQINATGDVYKTFTVSNAFSE